MTSLAEYYSQRYEQIMVPIVRLSSEKAWGTGTVIYSRENGNGKISTYVLTNWHVVESCIDKGERWDDILQKNIEVDKRKLVGVEFFTYQWQRRSVGGATVQADIMTYDPVHDLALIKLRDDMQLRQSATMYPRGEEAYAWLQAGMPVVCVGCGLAEDPVQAEGILSQFGKEIDYAEYWLNTGLSIFGNSGGALFLGDIGRRFPGDSLAVERQFNLIGVPSRIAVTGGFFGGTPITHLSYAGPVSRIYEFLEKKKFRFIYDDEYTEEDEAKVRKKMREEERWKEKREKD
jgi:hypothetical protein